MMTSIFLLIFAILFKECVESAKVKVSTQDGILEGFEYVSASGKTNYARFHGIPYAKPPLRDLRFKAPQPTDPWEGVRDATLYSPMCFQKDYKTDKFVGSEDCLYLNVYTPNMKPSKPLAVIFVIPGYLFRTGSGDNDFYGPGFLMDYDVVLVTINYRLGPFGFLCLDTEDVPGNAALMDQILALKWVQKNIKAFGGDPSKVTIYGHGAGAVSASLHYVSPLASGLFARIINISGVFFCDWCAPFEAKRYAFGLGRALGLYTEDTKTLLDLLRIVPAQKLLINFGILASDNTTILLKKSIFTPVQEKCFGLDQYMTNNPADLLMNGKVNKVDVMVGHTAQDALFNTYRNWDLILDVYPYFYRLFVPTRINHFRSPAETLEYSESIQKYYFGNDTVTPDTTKQFVQMASFRSMQYPTHAWVQSLPKDSSNNRYFFHFEVYTVRNHFSRQTKSLGIYEATIRDEASYLFDGLQFYPKLDKGSYLWKYVDLMCSLWTDFAKYGNPTPTSKFGVKWPLLNNKDNLYMVINNDGLQLNEFSSGPTQQDFWEELHRKANVEFRDPWVYNDDSTLSSLASSASCTKNCYESS